MLRWFQCRLKVSRLPVLFSSPGQGEGGPDRDVLAAFRAPEALISRLYEGALIKFAEFEGARAPYALNSFDGIAGTSRGWNLLCTFFHVLVRACRDK